MFVHSTRLPHVLAPDCYRSSEWYAREVETVLRPAWHMVCTTDDLARPGDFLTLDLLGVPLHLRNFDGELRALSNVCAHRHCLITNRLRGHEPRMTCQYHGWEYGSDGRTRKIPEPKNFAPFDRDGDRLPQYRLQTCGQLVFVSLAEDGPDLREQLGNMYDRLAERFGDQWRPYLKWDPNYDANWKVPIENTLEAYHVPHVHPTTFAEDPGGDRSTHVLDERHTWFGTDLPFSPHSRVQAAFQRCEGWLMRRLGQSPKERYEQHHLFPTFLCSFTDVISLVQSIIPIGPTTCRAVVRQFGRTGSQTALPWRLVASAWNRLEAVVTRRILAEDMSMFRSIQQGLSASTHPGVLGACEERIWKFQQWLETEVRGQKSEAGSQISEASEQRSAEDGCCDCAAVETSPPLTTHHSSLTT
jgi:phenylpropionate dioxygenase-like ring-hydroxylating dioxygenase large terminal subunit